MPYNKAAIRKLIEAAFPSVDDLRVFCSDYYTEVYQNFAPAQTRTERVLMLLDYAFNQNGVPRLLNLIEQEHADVYKLFADSLLDDAAGAQISTDPDPSIANALAQTKKGLQDEPSYYQRRFQDALDHIDAITNLKTLHDNLHELQFSHYPNISLEVKKIFDDQSEDKYARGNLSEYQDKFRINMMKMLDAVDQLKQYARRQSGGDRSSEVSEMEEYDQQVKKLNQARLDLKDGIEDHKQEQVAEADVTINNVIDTLPTAVDVRLFTEINVQTGRLEELVPLMSAENNKLSPGDARASQLQRGIAALELMISEISALIKEHTAWQEADSVLLTLTDSLQESVDEKRISQAFVKPWQRQKPKVAKFYNSLDDELSMTLQKRDRDMEAALTPAMDKAVAREALTPADCKSLQGAFDEFRGAARRRFLEVDKLLLENCTKLRKVREEVG
ncbi:MAG: hypothetical protein WCB68_11510 [Pyrinomonadaceae bacterium]